MTYTASQIIAEYIRPLNSSKYIIKDTLKLHTILAENEINDYEEDISYDLESLLTNVPVDDTTDYILDKIYINKRLKPLCKSRLVMRRLLTRTPQRPVPSPPEGNPYYEVPYTQPVPVPVPSDKARIASVRLSSNSNSSYKFHVDKDTPNNFNRQCSYVGDKDWTDDQDQENTILLQNRVQKRPLPEKPMESGNPLYSAASCTELPPEDKEPEKVSATNDLYSIYSTITDS